MAGALEKISFHFYLPQAKKDVVSKDNILIIGGAGYVGSHVAKVLEKEGFHPVVLDDLSTGHRTAARKLPFYEGDYADRDLVTRILKDHKITAAMHFGAKALVGESVENPLLYASSNIAGSIALLETLLANGVKRFVFSSTCNVFGDPDEVPIHEGVRKLPVNPYGFSKFVVEKVLADMDRAYGFRSAILRYFNAAGADPDGELGEDHACETHLIPNAVKALLGKAKELTIFGTDYPTPDGTCVRDYVHVNDLANAHIKALQLISSKNQSVDFNLGSENGYSVKEVISTLEKVSGKKVPQKTGARRPGDAPKLVADASKAKRELGWKIKFDLNEIVRTAYEWMKKHPNGYGD